MGMLRSGEFDYVILMESSGMYRGEDAVAIAAPLASGRLDGVWGSRRMSLKDVEAAMRLRYRRNGLAAATSHFGSHALSLLYLVLYGRYVSDTLSGLRAVRATYLGQVNVDPAHKLANHQLLSALLADRAEILELPVGFFPLAPTRVKRTSVGDGLRAMLEIVARRVRSLAHRRTETAAGVKAGEKPLTVGKT
jgi:hypothetical protein